MTTSHGAADSFVVARVGKPHGLRGEVTVQAHTDDPQGRFVPGAVFATEPPGRGPLTLRTVRVHQGTYLLAFEGHPDRTAAESRPRPGWSRFVGRRRTASGRRAVIPRRSQA